MAADGSGTGTARDEAERFASSMPDTYREGFADAASEHAAIAARRGGRVAHLERWRALEDGTSIFFTEYGNARVWAMTK